MSAADTASVCRRPARAGRRWQLTCSPWKFLPLWKTRGSVTYSCVTGSWSGAFIRTGLSLCLCQLCTPNADSEPGREADAEQDSEEVPVRGRCTALITWMLLLGRGYPLFYPSTFATYPHSGSPNSGTTNEAIYSNCHSLAYISVSLLCRYRIQYKMKDRRTPRLNQVSADEPLVISIDSLPSVPRTT